MDGKTLTFERSGLRGSNFFMLDSETGSRWQQLTGECFEGPMKGKRLAAIPFLLTTWAEWRATHPQTLALAPEPAYKANYEIMANRISGLPYGSSRSPERELIRRDARLPAYERIMGVEIRGAHKAYPLALLRKQAVLNDEVGSTPVLVVHNASSDTTTVFSRLVEGRTLEFHAAKPGDVYTLVDNPTRSKWTPYGECRAGKLKGRKLETIIPLPSLWFAWAEFYPDTQIYSEFTTERTEDTEKKK